MPLKITACLVTCVTSCVHMFFVYVKMGHSAQILRSSLLGCVNWMAAPCREHGDSAYTVTALGRLLRELNWIVLANGGQNELNGRVVEF